jgi:hypothetical protein
VSNKGQTGDVSSLFKSKDALIITAVRRETIEELITEAMAGALALLEEKKVTNVKRWSSTEYYWDSVSLPTNFICLCAQVLKLSILEEFVFARSVTNVFWQPCSEPLRFEGRTFVCWFVLEHSSTCPHRSNHLVNLLETLAIDSEDREHEAHLLAEALEGQHNANQALWNSRRSECQVLVGRSVL